MNLKWLKRVLTVFCVLIFAMAALSACGNKTKDEGGKGDATSDGTDGSAQNSNNPEELPGTDTSDATGEGNEVKGDDKEAKMVTPTVITEAEMRTFVENALGKKVDSFYDVEYQDEVEKQLENLQKKDTYNLDQPLFIMNPYGTNRLGLYVYLNTENDAYLEYTISVDEQVISDFTRHLFSNNDTEPESEHEGYAIGLVPGMKNTLTIRSYDNKNTITDKYVYKLDVPNSNTITQPILDVTQEGSLEELSDGLFALFEIGKNQKNNKGHILFYDNAGIVRSEIPLDGNAANSRIEFVDDNMLYACSDNQFALVDEAGEVQYVYTLDGYTLHHDFDYDEDEDCVMALATKNNGTTKEDCVVLLNLQNGEYTELFNFAELFPDIAKRAVNGATDPEGEGIGWIQCNSIQIQDTDNVIVGARELNSIIKIAKVRENPKVEYIISDPTFWTGTVYSNLLLKPNGSFTNHAGQYSVTYMKDKSLKNGQYYIQMFINNYGNSTSYDNFDYTVITNVGTVDKPAENSYYYRYLVDEGEGTYELVDSFTVPYSNVLGSTQEVDGNRVVCSGTIGVFGEYDADGNLIVEYKVAVPENDQLYHVFKYKMDGYWFN